MVSGKIQQEQTIYPYLVTPATWLGVAEFLGRERVGFWRQMNEESKGRDTSASGYRQSHKKNTQSSVECPLVLSFLTRPKTVLTQVTAAEVA